MVNVFFVYSHRDEALRDELEIHLAALKRQGVIHTWHDRRIVAGEEVHNEISEHLETDDIILLLVSPYFIASDYCYEVEMGRAMGRHEKKEATVIPVILHPCDWQRLPFGKLMATPKDGKPISKFPNQHEAFLEVTEAIRYAIERMGKESTPSVAGATESIVSAEQEQVVPDIRSSNLRIKKRFSDHEKDRFMTEAFEYIAKFFEGSLSELEKRHPEVATNFRRIDANHFTVAAYVSGDEVSQCKIWMAGRKAYPGGIAYSVGGQLDERSVNETLSVEDDGYVLFLKPLIGMSFYGRAEHQQMNMQGGAEYFWSMFIEPLQR